MLFGISKIFILVYCCKESSCRSKSKHWSRKKKSEDPRARPRLVATNIVFSFSLCGKSCCTSFKISFFCVIPLAIKYFRSSPLSCRRIISLFYSGSIYERERLLSRRRRHQIHYILSTKYLSLSIFATFQKLNHIVLLHMLLIL